MIQFYYYYTVKGVILKYSIHYDFYYFCFYHFNNVLLSDETITIKFFYY